MFAVSHRAIIALLALQLSCSAQANERFELSNGDAVVIDHQTGLVWQRDGKRKAIDLAAAVAYCQQLQLGNRQNWRLPKVKELISLVDESHYKPSAYPVFITAANLYWSSSVNPKRPGLNWTVNFSDGHVHAFREALDFSVRCVSEQSP